MNYEFGVAEEPAASLSVCIRSAWHVSADDSYDVPRQAPSPHGLVACWTLEGEGWLRTWSGKTFVLPPNSLLVIKNKEIIHYRCPQDAWHFWWFEFLASGTLPFPLDTPIPIAHEESDDPFMADILRLLHMKSPPSLALASASLARLLHLWIARCEVGFAPSPHRKVVDGVMQLMHKHSDGSLSIPQMAAAANLSQSRFRQVFHALTGHSPKQFYDELRLNKARELLRQGLVDVSQAADQLGFSSAFHFSKAFKSHFAHPPSTLLRKMK